MHLKITNGIPEKYTIGQLRRDNKNVSFPKVISENILNDFSVYSYMVDEKPSYDKRTQKIQEGDFYQEENQWRLGWVITDKTKEEIRSYDNYMNDLVKAEAQRRIYEILPEWKQRNLTAMGVELTIKGVENWTIEEQQTWYAGQEYWNMIKHVRVRSNEIEKMRPIPSNYNDDKYWT